MTYDISQIFQAIEELGGGGVISIDVCPSNAITDECILNETAERLGGIAPEDLIERLKSDGKWYFVRERRNDLLSSSDWTQGNDSPLTNEKKVEWANTVKHFAMLQSRKTITMLSGQLNRYNLIFS